MQTPWFSILVSMSLSALACGGGETAGASGGAGSSGTAGSVGVQCDAVDGRFTITHETNYSLPSSLSIGMHTLKDATDLTFRWDGLTRDLYGRTIDPKTDIDMVLISLWGMTPATLEGNLERDDLPLGANKGAITAYSADMATSENLLDFNLLGNPIPEEELWAYFDTTDPNFQYPQDSNTFMVMASTGTVVGKGGRMLAFFNLDPSSSVTELDLTNESATLEYTVELEQAKPLRVPASTPALTIDWSQMTLNALGNEFVGAQVTRATVAHFSSMTVPELEARFLELETLADGLWTGEVAAGRSLDLSTLLDRNQAPFPGIDDQGTWFVALFCTANCSNPAPWSITFLTACQ